MRLSSGDKLGPYEIVSLLGKGGMGEVYRATDTRLGRPVAIKVSSREFNDRFEREAKAISALNHPNICTLYDIGPNYLVMELVEGETLSRLIEQGPLPLDKALSHAVQIIDALAAAHAKGIIHRDLKPGNITVTTADIETSNGAFRPAAPVALGVHLSAISGWSPNKTGQKFLLAPPLDQGAQTPITVVTNWEATLKRN